MTSFLMPQYIENPTKNEGLKPTSGQRAISKGVLINECGLFATQKLTERRAGIYFAPALLKFLYYR